MEDTDMMSNIFKKLGAPVEKMEQMKKAETVMRMGSLHYKVIQNLTDKTLEIEWNEFIGDKVTPEIIRKRLDEIKKILK